MPAANPSADRQPSDQVALEAILSELNCRLDPAARRRPNVGVLDCVPRVRCADGFSVSVQAGRVNYCAPRDDDGPWYDVELGFPSERVEALIPFAEEEDRPTKTVYGWVPLTLVAEVILAHGGFAQTEAA